MWAVHVYLLLRRSQPGDLLVSVGAAGPPSTAAGDPANGYYFGTYLYINIEFRNSLCGHVVLLCVEDVNLPAGFSVKTSL